MLDLEACQKEMKGRLHAESDPMSLGRERSSNALWLEQHYTMAFLAERWGVSPETIRRQIKDDPDVPKFGEGETRNKRSYFTYTIPESVAKRLHAKLYSSG